MQKNEVRRLFAPVCKAFREFAKNFPELTLMSMDHGFMIVDLELRLEAAGKHPFAITYHPLRKDNVKWKPGGLPSKEKRAVMARFEKEVLGAKTQFEEARGSLIRIHKAALDTVSRKIRLEGSFGEWAFKELTAVEIEKIDEDAFNEVKNIFAPLRSAISEYAGDHPDAVSLWYRKVGCSITFGGEEPRDFSFVKIWNGKNKWSKHVRPDRKRTAMVLEFEEIMDECVRKFEEKHEGVFNIEDVLLNIKTGYSRVRGWFKWELQYGRN